MNNNKSWYSNKIKKEYNLKTRTNKKNWIRISDMKELKDIIYNSFVKSYNPTTTLKALALVIDEKLTRNLREGK